MLSGIVKFLWLLSIKTHSSAFKAISESVFENIISLLFAEPTPYFHPVHTKAGYAI